MSNFQIDEAYLNDFIIRGLAEDVATGDITSLACIRSNKRSNAILKVKDDGVIAGVALAERILRHVDEEAEIKVHIPDGSSVSYGDIAFEVRANSQALLKAERLLLNTMQRMSGIATMSNRFAFEVEDLPVKILDTRKTSPLLRHLEKWAVSLGGCQNYRTGLYDWFMIKDNHVEAAGGVEKALLRVKTYKEAHHMQDYGVTIEVRNFVELHEALNTGYFNRVMLDNFELPLLREAVLTVNKAYETEASGGITIHNVRKYALTGVNYVSVGALTHSAQCLDLSLKIQD